MANAPEHVLSSPPYNYSTLEAANASHFNKHSSLEPVPIYHAHDHPSEQKQAYQAVELQAPDSEAGRSDAAPQKGTRRRVWGMTLKIALIIAIILLLVITGAVVRGLDWSHKKGNDTDGGEENGTHYALHASYDKDLLIGAPAVRPSLTENTTQLDLQQWQLYPVPAHWPNATMEVPFEKGNRLVNTSRSFWISSRYYWPSVFLSFYDDVERWTSIFEGTNMTVTYPLLSLRPKDLSNPAQYWFAVCFTCWEARRNCCKFYDMEAGIEYRIWMNEEAGWRVPLMGTGNVYTGAWDAWEVFYWEEIEVNDGGFEWSIA